MAGFVVHHPLLGASVPTLEDLRARADDVAAEALDVAARLAQHRIAEQRQLYARAVKLDAPPWAGGVTRLCTHPEALVPGDLLQALLVCDADRLAQAMGEDLRAEAWSLVVASLGSWSGPARRAPPRLDDFVLALQPEWARRWALHDVRHGRPSVTVPVLLSALGRQGPRALAAYSLRHEEGRATADEVAAAFLQRLPREVGQRLFEAVPPAYVDRHGGLEALEAGLQGGPGVLVVGTPRSGRSELLRAWVRQATADGRRADWQGRTVVLDPHRASEDGGPVPPGAVVALTVVREDPRAAVQWLLAHAGELSSLRVAMVVDADALPGLLRDVPTLDGFGLVEVPPVEPSSLAAIWLAHAIMYPGLGLAEVLEVLQALGLQRAGRIDPWAFEQLVEVPGLLPFYDGEQARQVLGSGGEGRVLQLQRDAGVLERRLDPTLLEALGGPSALDELRALEEQLRLA